MGTSRKTTRQYKPPLKGPEQWRTINGEVFCYWDLWLLVLVARAEEGWKAIRRDLKERHRFDTMRRDSEAKLSQVTDLRQRIERLGQTPRSVLGDLIDDKKLLTKARTKILDQTAGDRHKTRAMRETPREQLSRRALRGNWEGFPVSPSTFDSPLASIVGRRNFYPERASFGLAKKLEQQLCREEKRLKGAKAEKLALYRAFLTVVVESMHRLDDSYGVIGDLYQEKLPTYLDMPWAKVGLTSEVYFRDFLEFAIWEDYGLMGENLAPWFAAIEAPHIALVESILRELMTELEEHELEYQHEEAQQLLAQLFVQQKQLDRFVGLAEQMGSRAWEPILNMAAAAWKARQHELALAVFAAADQPGFHRDYLRMKCQTMTG
ncbi:MAG: hypothetical protein KAI47_28445, partial [Deltaproteobacteria bacterium]|nr:hypothetical protein [Deltaproteobacteria bacterium]